MPSDTEAGQLGPSDRLDVPGREPVTSASPLIMPWFYSAPWLPKFNGERRRFHEWRAQVRAMLRAQPLSGEQEADFAFSALEEEARREVALLEENRRDTGDNILTALEELYGETINAAQAHAAFFKCRQSPEEKVRDFILRLRACHAKWRQLDRGAAGGEDDVLLDQFVLGIKIGPVRTELQRHLRRHPRQGFKVGTTEARALEEELESGMEGAQASVIRTTPACTAAVMDRREEPPGQTHKQKDDWKEEMRQELQQELSEQVKALGVQLMEQVRGFAAPTIRSGNSPRVQAQDPTMPLPIQAGPSRGTRYQWDPQGRPICLDCGEAGHIQRNCPKRQRPARGFQNPPPQQAGRWG